MENELKTMCANCGKEIAGVLVNYDDWGEHIAALNSMVASKGIEYLGYECAECHAPICSDCSEQHKEKFNFKSSYTQIAYVYKYLRNMARGELHKCPKCQKRLRILRETNIALTFGPVPLLLSQEYGSDCSKRFVSSEANKILDDRVVAVKDADSKGIALCEVCGSPSISTVKTGCCTSCLSFGLLPGHKMVCAKCGYERFQKGI
jgi:hypothetical protein